VDSGRLKNSIGYEASPSMVAVGTSVEYASTHQEGATIEAKSSQGLRFQVGGRWVTKKAVTVPARPFIGISAEDETQAKGCVLGHIGRAFGK
jgi:phage gpG-like protein